MIPDFLTFCTFFISSKEKLSIRSDGRERPIFFSSVKSLSDARKKAIKARLKTYSIDDFEELFKKAESSTFLKGGNNRNWTANFDWLIKDSNMAKVLDGNYENKKPANTGIPSGSNQDDLDDFF